MKGDPVPRYLSLVILSAPEAIALTPAKLANWCRRYTPLAAADAPDGAMLDISGVAHLFGGEARLVADIEKCFVRQGFGVRAAVANTPEAAWALARFGRVRLAPAEADEKALRRLFGALPVAALRLSDDIALALSRSGLKCVDDILMRPRAPIAARFGQGLFDRLDGLMGRAKSPITPRFEAPAYVMERRFAEPISRMEDVRGVIAELAVDLCAMLDLHAEGARQLEASLFRVDGVALGIAASASRPLRDPKIMALLFEERIKAASERRQDDPLDSGCGFDLVRLSAMEVERLPARQEEFPSSHAPEETREESGRRRNEGPPGVFQGGSGAPRPASGEKERIAFIDLLDRLGARLGTRRVTRLIDQDTHIPEFAMAMVPVARMRSPSSHAQEEGGQRSIGNGEREQNAPRPIRLFERPEPIETLAEVPDGPPLRFRWRRVMHEVAAIEGPERIAPEWWKGAGEALTRDYFHVEDTDGARFWVFREGLYNAQGPRPRWFMHGLFA